MASVKIVLDKRYKQKDKKYHLCIQISHKSKTRLIKLGYSLLPEQWNEKKLEVKGIDNSKRVTAKIHHQLLKAERYLIDKELEIRIMDATELKKQLEVELLRNKNTSQNTLEKAKYVLSNQGTLESWGNILIERLLKEKRVGTAKWYSNGINSFMRFNKGKDVSLISIDESFLEEFKVWATQEIDGEKKTWKPNSIGNAMRAVRSIINKSIKEKKGFIPDSFQPFRNVSIPNEVVEVDSISKKEINAIRELDLEYGSDIWKARMRFLFMFNSQGMNFTDLARLKVSDYQDGVISYYRAKTSRSKKRKKIEVALTSESKVIWDYFTHEKKLDDYAFDILCYGKKRTPKHLIPYQEARKSDNPAVTEKNRIVCYMKKQNRLLGKMSTMIGFKKKITTYDCRYGFVNSALDAGISEELIGKSLGHKNLAVTRTYFEEKHKRTNLGKKINELITQ